MNESVRPGPARLTCQVPKAGSESPGSAAWTGRPSTELTSRTGAPTSSAASPAGNRNPRDDLLAAAHAQQVDPGEVEPGDPIADHEPASGAPSSAGTSGRYVSSASSAPSSASAPARIPEVVGPDAALVADVSERVGVEADDRVLPGRVIDEAARPVGLARDDEPARWRWPERDDPLRVGGPGDLAPARPAGSPSAGRPPGPCRRPAAGVRTDVVPRMIVIAGRAERDGGTTSATGTARKAAPAEVGSPAIEGRLRGMPVESGVDAAIDEVDAGAPP